MNIRVVIFLMVVLAGAFLGQFIAGTRPAQTPRIDPTVLETMAPYMLQPIDREKHRVLVVGWDGASFEFLDPLLRTGRMPHLESILRRGVSANLASTIIPISSAAWTTATTGKWPAKTDVFSFFKGVPDSYEIEVISSLQKKAPSLWRILNHHEKRCVVFGVPVTYPPEPVKDILVAGMLSPENADYTWPPELADALRSLDFLPDLGIWREQRILTRDLLYGQLEIKRHVVNALLAGNDWDLGFVVFKSLDVLKHRGVATPEERARIDELYIYLDGALGGLLALAGKNCDVIVLSDHGFTAYQNKIFLNGWLSEKGFTKLNEERMQEREAFDDPIAERRASEHMTEISLLELDRTIAFAGPCEGNFGSIQLNQKGREPNGIVDPSNREAVIDRILDSLSAAPVYPGGPPLVKRAMRATDLYRGPFESNLPDILFEVHDSIFVEATAGIPSIVKLHTPLSDHTLDGFFAAAGPSFRYDRERGEASIVDITPTLLHLLDLPVYDDMDGAPRTDRLTIDRAVRKETEPEALHAPAANVVYSEEELKELKARLRSMAYTR
ncbi:MAG: hypothetical protein HKN20_10360 [Gemmatimonadetes bacterium]|nr:hypothetical protein [Gemmatimonadota bacterium]